MQRFLDPFISINCTTYFRRFLRPSSGAQDCTYSFRYYQTNTAACWYLIPDRSRQQYWVVRHYLTIHVHFCAPDDGRRNRLKHVEQFIEINRSRKRLHLVGCTLEIYLRCTDMWTSNLNVKNNGYFTWRRIYIFDHSSQIFSCCKKCFRQICRENPNIHFIFRFFTRKSCRLWGNVEKYRPTGHATDDNLAHAHCTLDT